MTNQSVWAVVPAAGIGSRMQADRPKQYLDLNGKMVLQRTLQGLVEHSCIEGIVVAVADNDPWWAQISVDTTKPVHVAIGGKERADSVYNALIALANIADDNPWVMVHDAARPCLRHSDIDQMLTRLSGHSVGGILGIPVTDTVKRTNEKGDIIETVERQGLWRASTPQMFRLNTLKEALLHAKKQQLVVTDEASAIEFMGLQAMMIEGHADNIKITLPQDLDLAGLFLKQQGKL